MSLCQLLDLRRKILGARIQDNVGTQFSSPCQFVV